MWKYVKSAFFYHWNLLAFVGGMGFAALSGHADVIAPLVVAGEVAYLGMLSTHPKYQSYVNAQEAKGARQESAVNAEQAARRILATLPEPLVRRFDTLRNRCRDLQAIARDFPDATASPAPLEQAQVAGLDRLLWIYLRLLYTQHSMRRFLSQTSERELQANIADLQGRIKGMTAETAESPRTRMRKSLEDNLATSQARLENYRKARDNAELVDLEIDRLENKIRTLSEMSVNRHEPGFVSGQVDEVAQSLAHTERTMSDLQFITGMESADEEVPELLQRPTVQARN